MYGTGPSVYSLCSNDILYPTLCVLSVLYECIVYHYVLPTYRAQVRVTVQLCLRIFLSRLSIFNIILGLSQGQQPPDDGRRLTRPSDTMVIKLIEDKNPKKYDVFGKKGVFPLFSQKLSF